MTDLSPSICVDPQKGDVPKEESPGMREVHEAENTGKETTIAEKTTPETGKTPTRRVGIPVHVTVRARGMYGGRVYERDGEVMVRISPRERLDQTQEESTTLLLGTRIPLGPALR